MSTFDENHISPVGKVLTKCLGFQFTLRDLKFCLVSKPRTNSEYFEWLHCISNNCDVINDYLPYIDRSRSRTTPVPSALSSRTPSSTTKGSSYNDEILKIIAYYILLPLVAVLVVVCLVLGIVLLVKSYKMKPLKHNLALAIRRSRQVGHAPDNNYVSPDDVHNNSNNGNNASESDNRRSLPPPEVLRAARARASQLFHLNNPI